MYEIFSQYCSKPVNDDSLQLIVIFSDMSSKIKFDKNEYLKELKKFESVVGSAIMISDSIGGIKTNIRNIRAVQLYTKLTLSAMSIMRLLPHNTYCPMIEEI